MQNFVLFHAIETEIGLFENFGETAPPTELHEPKLHHCYFQIIHILHIIFCAILSTRNRDQLSPKILGKG